MRIRRAQRATVFAASLAAAVGGNDISGKPVTVSSSGLKAVYAGTQFAAFFGVPNSDPRHPDVLGIAQHGVVYNGGTCPVPEILRYLPPHLRHSAECCH